MAQTNYEDRLDPIVRQQNVLHGLREKEAKLGELIGEQQRIIASGDVEADTTSVLRKRRGALMVDAAAGADVAEELADIDQAIAKASTADQITNTTKANEVARATDLVETARANLEAIQQQIVAESQILKALQVDFLRHWAEEEAGLYHIAADKLAESAKTIIAIDHLLRTSTGLPSGVMGVLGLIGIPAVGDMPKKRLGYYFMQQTKGRATKDDLAAIDARLEQLGIERIA